MSSLLTNTGAMVALQTLRTINKGLATAQTEIATGKRIPTAREDAAMWSIAAVMNSDVQGFKAVAESLSLGSATLNVGRDGAEAVAGLLDGLNAKVIAAQEPNVDRDKIQKDVKEFILQIEAAVAATQFNGMPLLQDARDVTILSSLNRSDGGLSADHISYRVPDLSDRAGTPGGGAIAGPPVPLAVTPAGPLAAGEAAVFSIAGRTVTAGDGYRVALAGVDYDYVAAPGDTTADVAAGLAAVIALRTAGTAEPMLTAAAPDGAGGASLTVTVSGAAALAVATSVGGEPSGGLLGLADFDVSTERGARAALDVMDRFINAAIDAAAGYGSAQQSVATAESFVSKVADSFITGIGGMVDTDMEAASARLQALQVRQQLGTQALSIANQQPQALLTLFQR